MKNGAVAQRASSLVAQVSDGRHRAVVENLSPCIDGGRFAVKRVIGDTVVVGCDAFTDGHDQLSCAVLFRRQGDSEWQEAEMAPLGNDAWQGTFTVGSVGRYDYVVEARVDHFRSWRHDLGRREDERDIAVHLLDGATMLRAASERATSVEHSRRLSSAADTLADERIDVAERRDAALDDALGDLAIQHGNRDFATRSMSLPLVVDDRLAGFSAWYEFFPRSSVIDNDPTAPVGVSTEVDGEPLRHATLRESIGRLDYIAQLGFDVVYLPPVHPIGRIDRKGRNNTLTPDETDVGVPWAIGATEGGHSDIHPRLGTLDDFRAFVEAARGKGLEVALDIAFQCAPDHPWVQTHPDWFRRRPDGTVQFAENPPKKYQDIYPFDFECDDWQGLWDALKEVFLHWIAQGVRVFRIDNPHTKPYPFWEWVIAEIKRERPDAIFLAEAFTRPKLMHRLAKLGFTHSYTYFTWRNTRAELEEYLLEVSRGPGREYMRPNFWPNTPDILHETLQQGGHEVAALRLVLAATMSSNYGIYGPVFELAYATPREPGSEEYLDSEKYQLRRWNLSHPASIAPLLRHVNRIRRDYPALQDTYNAHVHGIDNERLICYSKSDPHGDDVLIIVNLDPHAPQAGWTSMNMQALGLAADADYELFDLLSGETFHWQGARNFVALEPRRGPAHICTVRAR